MAFWRIYRHWIRKLSALADWIVRAVSRHPILVCCVIGFLGGALLDLDHVPLWLFHVRYPILVRINGPFPLAQGRNLHGLALIGSGIIGAYAGGLILLLVLTKAIDKQHPNLSRATKKIIRIISRHPIIVCCIIGIIICVLFNLEYIPQKLLHQILHTGFSLSSIPHVFGFHFPLINRPNP